MAVTAAELNIRILTQGAAQAKADLAGVGESVNAAGAAGGLAMAALGTGMLDMTKSMIGAGATFQQEMQFINSLATNGGTVQTLQMLQDEATKLDRTTVFSLQDISAGMEQLAREGFTPLQIAGTDATNSLIQNSANMAAALRINMQDASNMLGMTMRAYQEDVSQTANVTDILTEAALRSGKSADEFNTQLQYVEATAHQLGIPLQDIAAATGELMSQNVPGAGQGLRAFLVGITASGSTANKELTKLGISAYDAQGQFVGLPTIIDEINAALSKLSPSEQSAAIKALSGGNRQVTALIQLLKDGSKGITDFETKMGSLGGAANVMSSLMDTAAGSFKAFTSSLETAKILIGESFLPLLRPVTDGLRELLGAFIQGPAFLHAFAAAAIAVSGVLLTLAGGMSLFKALGMKATLGEMVAGLLDVAGTMLPVIALAGAFYLAWEHNFLGFQSLVRGVVADVQTFADAFGKVFGTNLRRTDPLSAVLASASWGAAAINLQGLSRLFDQLAVSSHAVWLQFSALAQQVMPSLNAAWRELGLANDHVVTGVQDLLAGDVPGMLRNWHAALTEVQFAWSDFSNAVGTLASNALSLGKAIGGWVLNVGIPTVAGDIAGIASAVWDWVQNTAWPAVKNAIPKLEGLALNVGKALVNIAGWAWGKIVSLATWLAGAVFSLEGEAGKIAVELGTALVNITGWAWGKVASLATWLAGEVFSLAGSAGKVVAELGTGLVNITGWAEGKILPLALWVAAWVKGHLPSAQTIDRITLSITRWEIKAIEIGALLAAWVAAHSIGLIETIGSIGLKVLKWELTALGDFASQIGQQIQAINWSAAFQGAAAAIALGLAAALSKGIPTLLNLMSGVMEHVDYLQVGRAIGNGIGKAVGAMVEFGPLIALNLIKNMSASDWVSFGTAVARFIFDAIQTAINAPTLLLVGIIEGLVNAFKPVGAAIANAIGDGLSQAWGAITKTFETGLDQLITQANKAIDALNKVWTALGNSPIPSIPLILQADKIKNAFLEASDAAKQASGAVAAAFQALTGVAPPPHPTTAPPPAPKPGQPGTGYGPAPIPAIGQLAGGGISPAPPLNTLPVPTPAGPPAPAVAPPVAQLNAQIGALQTLRTLYPQLAGTLNTLTGSSTAYSNAAKGMYTYLLSNTTQTSSLAQQERNLAIMLNDSSMATDANTQASIQAAGGISKIGAAGAAAVTHILAFSTSTIGLGNGVGVLGSRAAAAAAGIGTFAARTVSSVASTAGLSAAASAAGAAIGRFATQAATSAASTAVFAAQLAAVKSRVDSFTAGVTSGMQSAIAAVASAGASIRAAAELIGLSLAAAGTSGGLQFANGIGLGALQAAADMASAGAAIEGIATSIMGALAAAGSAAGASFAAGIAAGMAVAEGAAAAGVGAIIAICSAVDLFGAGFATGASFGAGVAAGLASEEGAVAAEASAIVATAAAASAAAAQIHSPSRLFRDKIGVPIAQGVAVGIREGATFVQDAARSLISLPTLPSTYNASGAVYGPSGGITVSPSITVNLNGTTTDPSELAAQVAEKIGPVLVHIGTQIRRGQGALR